MLRTVILALLIYFSSNAFCQSFELKPADTAKLNLLVRVMDYHESIGYLYLKDNYKVIAERDSVQYGEWENEDGEAIVCAFQQDFESGIHYSIWECRGEGGMSEKIIFPKIEGKKLKKFVELLFYDESNEWTTETTYEPDGAGCYYQIIQTENNTIIDVYCGC